MNNKEIRNGMVNIAQSLFWRGLTGGSSGNLSVKLDDGWFISPTNSSFGTLKPEDISHLDLYGNLIAGSPPSKEFLLHKAFLSNRPQDRAVIHLHSSYAVAVSCLNGVDPDNVLPPITPYSVMKFGQVALIPYSKPGNPKLVEDIGKISNKHSAVILANHGPIVAAPTLEKAQYSIEELEETAKVYMILQGNKYRVLDKEQVNRLNEG